jgi:AcrR family transcriptional regulator/DNA-binding Xre family transcriptional regulator
VSDDVGPAIRAARLARGMSLRELARRVEVSPATMSAIETDRSALVVSRLRTIAAALSVSAGELLDGPDVDPVPFTPDPAGWRHYGPLDVDPVLRAAIEEFVETGYHGTTMRSIAARAGMSVPGVYHHYARKQDLLVRIFELTMADLHWRVRDAREEGRSSAERLRLVVYSLALFHTHRRELGFLGSSEMRGLEQAERRRIAAMRTGIQRVVDAEVAAGLADGTFSTRHPRDAARAISTMCTSLAQWFRLDGTRTPEQVAAEYSSFALQLLRNAQVS